jgi:hypothetical protein
MSSVATVDLRLVSPTRGIENNNSGLRLLQAHLENHDVLLNLPVKLGKLTPGRYLLALRREGPEWVYYPLILK